MPFQILGLSDLVLKAIADAGYKTPTPIQEQAIPKVLLGLDVLGCAQTGTGKTASFTLPMIDILAEGRARARMPRSLILEPTRELAAQVAENFETYGKYHKLSMALLIGGVSFDKQNAIIDRGADVLIATPGRLLDHVERGRLLLRGIDILVIDEADRMLDMGFIPDVERIVSLCNPKRQTLFFSATMAKEIRRLADKFLDDPVEITVAPPASVVETVEQGIVTVQAGDKRAALRQMLRSQDVKNCLIFCNRKRDVDIVRTSLRKHGFDASALHGDLSQVVRTATLESFKKGELSILVCSDVAARGLDIKGLSHVFLFDVPFNAEDYVHRIGRTGRAGRRGIALTLATPDDAKLISAIENLIKQKIPKIAIEGMDEAKAGESDRSPRGGGRNANRSGGRSTGRSGGRSGGRNTGRSSSRSDGEKDARTENSPQTEAATSTPEEKPVETTTAQTQSEQQAEHTDSGASPQREKTSESASKAKAPRRSKKSSAVKSSTTKSSTAKSSTAKSSTAKSSTAKSKTAKPKTEGKPEQTAVGMGDHVPAFLLRSRRPTE